MLCFSNEEGKPLHLNCFLYRYIALLQGLRKLFLDILYFCCFAIPFSPTNFNLLFPITQVVSLKTFFFLSGHSSMSLELLLTSLPLMFLFAFVH